MSNTASKDRKFPFELSRTSEIAQIELQTLRTRLRRLNDASMLLEKDFEQWSERYQSKRPSTPCS